MLKLHKIFSISSIVLAGLYFILQLVNSSQPGSFNFGFMFSFRYGILVVAIPICFGIYSLLWNKRTVAGQRSDSTGILIYLGFFLAYITAWGLYSSGEELFAVKEKSLLDSILSFSEKQPSTLDYIGFFALLLALLIEIYMVVVMIVCIRKPKIVAENSGEDVTR
jgi:cytochrome bd-type quinol oxidase subunit 1